MEEIYLDNSATTKCYPEVAQLMTKILCEDYGNPSSLHLKGITSEGYIREAKKTIAGLLKVSEKEILFTSGGTESDNTALIGAAMANKRSGNRLITTSIEHPAVLRTMEFLEEQGFKVTYLPVNSQGVVELEDFKKAMTPDTILVSIMHTNNEVGALEPIEEISKLAKEINPSVLVHVDAVQGFGKDRINPKKQGIDMLSVSAHKIHGPKGVGFLYINDKVKIKPLVLGGGQQKNMRSGTENVAGIAGMALAASMIYENLDEKRDGLFELKELLANGISALPDTVLNGPQGREGAPHILSASFSGVRSEVLLHSLESKGIYVSAGSACASNKPHVSDTLQAMGVANELLDSTIRFSLSEFNTKEDIDKTIEALNSIVPMLRKYTRH